MDGSNRDKTIDGDVMQQKQNQTFEYLMRIPKGFGFKFENNGYEFDCKVGAFQVSIKYFNTYTKYSGALCLNIYDNNPTQIEVLIDELDRCKSLDKFMDILEAHILTII